MGENGFSRGNTEATQGRNNLFDCVIQSYIFYLLYLSPSLMRSWSEASSPSRREALFMALPATAGFTPRAISAEIASSILPPGVSDWDRGVSAPPVGFARKASLSFSSTQRRSAVFLPIAGMVVSVRMSFVAIARANSSIGIFDSMASPSFGPMPLVAINTSNMSRS